MSTAPAAGPLVAPPPMPVTADWIVAEIWVSWFCTVLTTAAPALQLAPPKPQPLTLDVVLIRAVLSGAITTVDTVPDVVLGVPAASSERP
ncbi:MAG: hypothetical protein PGN08_00210 [Sphingomonas taxi]